MTTGNRGMSDLQEAWKHRPGKRMVSRASVEDSWKYLYTRLGDN